MKTRNRFTSVLVLTPFVLTAQVPAERDLVPLKSWPAPLYWQPSQTEVRARLSLLNPEVTPQVQTPAASLVFVGMTPCRIADTRASSGFIGAFGPPGLAAGATRTFPISSSPNCSIPSTAHAYSLNITVIPSGILGYLTIWPTGQPQPVVSTLNSLLGAVVANAAIVPAGTAASIDVFASNATDLVMDINGYYAPLNGITLAQGTAGAPSLSFANDTGTGIFSSGAGTLSIATGGTNRLTVDSAGNVAIGATVLRGGGAALPRTCNVGDQFFLTSGAAGNYQCTAPNTWTLPGNSISSGAGGVRTLNGPGTSAKCQAGTAAGAFSFSTASAPLAECESDGIQGYLPFAASTPQIVYDRFDLPVDWMGTLKAVLVAYSASTSIPTIRLSLSCNATGATANPRFGAAQTISLAPAASSGRTMVTTSLATDLSHANKACAAGDSVTWSLAVTAASAADLRVLRVQFTE